MKNEEIYQLTKVKKWSEIIRKRRLSWVGHLLRLDEDTPARLALREACKEVKRNIGKHKLTWIEVIKKDLHNNSNLNLPTGNDRVFFEELAKVCEDRVKWRKEISHMMLNTTNM